jgi:predicted SnoaL-like aldol condensation-catalyzing enzyme
MTRKEIASSFLQDAAEGNVESAFAKARCAELRHHNPWFPSDARSLSAAMADNARKNPGKKCTIHRAIEEGDIVALHSHVRHNAEERGYALVHIFRFEGDKIAELWDIAMEVPADSPNKAGMF